MHRTGTGGTCRADTGGTRRAGTGGTHRAGTGGTRRASTGGMRRAGTGGTRRAGGYRRDAQGGYKRDAQGGYRRDAQGGYRRDAQGGYRRDAQDGYRRDAQDGWGGDQLEGRAAAQAVNWGQSMALTEKSGTADTSRPVPFKSTLHFPSEDGPYREEQGWRGRDGGERMEGKGWRVMDGGDGGEGMEGKGWRGRDGPYREECEAELFRLVVRFGQRGRRWLRRGRGGRIAERDARACEGHTAPAERRAYQMAAGETKEKRARQNLAGGALLQRELEVVDDVDVLDDRTSALLRVGRRPRANEAVLHGQLAGGMESTACLMRKPGWSLA
ncbi:hypothetical protein T492DRAFT_1144442 [Pavlovales sp. CCMP2436]|nr:hypothetical protein T492DRAFT_1144442 [Pavlovales sp. CCMP2436]